MSDDFFHSSDAVRSAMPLRYARTLHLPGPLRLELGGTLPAVTVAYETWGRLAPDRSNAVLVCHALSGDSHAARHDADDAPGWWDICVGPGRPIDTERWFVVCANVLGSCRGTTGPNSVNPETGRPWGSDFPTVTVRDMVTVQARLLDHLGIPRLHAVVGGSLGGFQALIWAIDHPDRVATCVPIATSPRLTAQALAFDVVGRNAILHDPNFRGGQYYDAPAGPDVGLALARMLAHITYLSPEAMREKFDVTRYTPRDVATAFEKKFSVGSYLAYQGHKFVERFDANSYITLSMAMDLFDLGDSPERLRAALAPARCRWLLVGFSSDWLFPPAQCREMVEALLWLDQRVSWCEIPSTCGHDAFLLGDDIGLWGPLLAGFLESSAGDDLLRETVAGGESRTSFALLPPSLPPTSIFHRRRLDYDLIASLIEPGQRVLDLGCGDGELLARLAARGHRRSVGVELDPRAVVVSVGRGLDVIQADLEHGLPGFRDGQFDVAVLSQTLQSVTDTERLLDEMLRVARRAIVSFPNFAFRELRAMLWYEGRSPKTRGAYGYDWWNTPNRRFPSLLDVEELCARRGIAVARRVAIDSATGTQVVDDPNLNADLAILVLAREGGSPPSSARRR